MQKYHKALQKRWHQKIWKTSLNISVKSFNANRQQEWNEFWKSFRKHTFLAVFEFEDFFKSMQFWLNISEPAYQTNIQWCAPDFYTAPLTLECQYVVERS